MVTDPNDRKTRSLEEVRAFLAGTAEVAFYIQDKLASGAKRTPKAERATGAWIRSIQGDLDGIKGVYHINAVDEVTRFQCVFSVERISERVLIPVPEASSSCGPMPTPSSNRTLPSYKLDAIALTISDNQAAQPMNEAKRLLFTTIFEQDRKAV